MARNDWAPETDRLTPPVRDLRIAEHLSEAHIHLQAAQALVYGVGRQYRGLRFQRALNHVQDRVLKLHLRELKGKR